MNFSENLQTLRKQRGWTQEQLAELLQVSRQAVTKWESGQSSPDLERIMQICHLFQCDLNTLVQGSVPMQGSAAPEPNTHTFTTKEPEHEAPFSPLDAIAFNEQKREYNAFYQRHSLAMSGGVSCVLWGVTLLLFFGNFGLEALGVVLLLCMIAIATFLFIFFGMQYDRFKADHPKPADYYDEQERRMFQRHFPIGIGLGVVFVLIGVILCVSLALLGDKGYWASSALMLCITVGTGILVYFGIQSEKYENTKPKNQGKDKDDPISGMIMLTATAIFLIAGFVFHRWHPAWVVFPIGGILCGIIENWRKRSQ